MNIETLKEKMIERIRKNEGGKLTERQINNSIKKELKIIDDILEQKTVKKIEFNIIWKNNQARLDARVFFQDGAYLYIDGIKTSGWGYDKASTVLADLLNQLMKKELLNNLERIEDSKTPYGIGKYGIDKGFKPHFEGGVGIECYPDIMAFIGYNMKRTATGKTFDAYTIEKKGAETDEISK